MKPKKIESKFISIVIIIILCISTTVSAFFLVNKSGYYIDEGMTFNLANGVFNGAVTTNSQYDLNSFLKEFVYKENLSTTFNNVLNMLSELANKGNYSKEGTVEWYDSARSLFQGQYAWVSGTEIKNSITADKGNQFQYMQVYLNQAVDVHPPLYYFIIHTIFSMFPGVFTNFFPYIVNYFFLLGTCVILYFFSTKLFHDEVVALAAVGIYSFSNGYMSCAIYFRMYAMLTFFIILLLYLHVILFEQSMDCNGKLGRVIMCTVIGGFLTQYYFILFCIPLAVCTMIYMLKKQLFQQFRQYLIKMFLAGLISLILWPFALYHIFFWIQR